VKTDPTPWHITVRFQNTLQAFFFLTVLGLELRAYTHFTLYQPFSVMGFSR
jgi:hypothetical protein